MPQYDEQLGELVVDEAALDRLAARDLSPLSALESVRQLVNAVDVDRGHEAQPMMPMATLSVTEDMATCMRLHAMGWRSVYHHEVLAHGLAPDDLGTMMQQRLRWAQGTLQVMLKENPLVQKGLSIPQRLMYFSTMWSYLSGFAAVVFLAAPFIYLIFGVLPVNAYGMTFLAFFAPYIIVNQLLFFAVGYGRSTWRGHQFSLALFPLWIRACWTAAANVWFHRPLGFVVTPKTAMTRGPAVPLAPRVAAAARRGAAPVRRRHRWRATADRVGRQRHRHRGQHAVDRLRPPRAQRHLAGRPLPRLRPPPRPREGAHPVMQVHTSTIGDATVLSCDGRLTMVAAPALRSAIDEAVSGGRVRLVVDLAGTSFVDSSGLGALVAGLKRTRQAGGDLRIASAQEQVRMVLNLTNLDRILQPFDTVGDAVHGW